MQSTSGREAMFGISDMRSRRYRLPLALRVWVLKNRKTPEAELGPRRVIIEDTVTENISSSGCYFLLSDPPPIGSKTEMEIRMSSADVGFHAGKIRCSGKVVRVESNMGQRGKVGVACTIDHYRFVPED
jgi:hypothetical protein